MDMVVQNLEHLVYNDFQSMVIFLVSLGWVGTIEGGMFIGKVDFERGYPGYNSSLIVWKYEDLGVNAIGTVMGKVDERGY